MSDLEEGEIENDNEPKEEAMVVPTNNYNMLESKGTTELKLKSFEERPKAVPKYRTTARPLNSSSESESNEEEEDTPLWKQKKAKYFRKHKDGSHAHCPSPTLPEFVPGSKNNSSNNSCSASNKAKANNVWGSVLQEQDLTRAMVEDTSLKRLPGSRQERTVESYDFTQKYNDTRPHVHSEMPEEEEGGVDSHDPFDKVLKSTVVKSRGREVIGYDDTLLDSGRGRTSRKRKLEDNSENNRSVHNRLGTKKATTMKVGDLSISEDMEIKELAKNIAEYIHEPKVELIERVAENMGKDVAIRILNQTRDIEESGGMLTLDGSRKRTPGGVYLQMLKQQPEYSKEKYKLIFVEDHTWRLEANKQKKQRQRARRKERKQDSKKASASPSKTGEENMEDGEIKNTKSDTISPSEQMDCGEKNKQVSQSRKPRSSSQNGNRGERVKSVDSQSENSRCKSRRSRSYSDHDDDDDDEDSDSSTPPRKSGEFDFQAELEAAKKLITKAKDTTSKDVEEMDEIEDDLDDLDEANVVDIPLDD